MKKTFTNLIAALALLVFMMPSLAGWGQTRADGDTHDFSQSLSQLLNNNASIPSINIAEQSYPVKKVTVVGSYNKSYNPAVTIAVSVGGTSWGTQQIGGSGSFSKDFTGTSTVGAIVISFTNETGSGTGHGTFNVTKVTLTEGATSTSYSITAQSNNTSYGTVALNGTTITATPESGYRVSATTPYDVSPDGSATVNQSTQNPNVFTVTPSANTTVTINFEEIPTNTATFSINGTTSSQDYLVGATIVFPTNIAAQYGKPFVGWVTAAIPNPTDTEPSFIDTAHETMGENDVTYYAVFATAEEGEPTETKIQTLQYDSWTKGGSSTDKPNNSYRLFHEGGYVESSAFDLSKLSKVIVYGGTFGGDSYNSLTIGDGTNTWKDVTVSGSSQTGQNTFTGGNALTGTKALRVTSTCGSTSGNGSGVRMSKVEIFITEPTYTYSAYCTTVTAPAVVAPQIAVGNNPFLFSTTATITCETPGATIKYSYDGETWSDYSSVLAITATTTVYAKAIKDANESSVTSVTITKNLAEPTVTVSGDLTLDLNGETSVAAGTLTAAVTYNDEPVQGATVSWESNHTNIAEIDASTGAVTIKAVGEVTFTATYAGNSDYAEATGTKTVTVTDSQAPGTVNNPYTVAQAISNTPSSGTSANVYIHGIVSAFYGSNDDILDDSYHRYYISDDGTTTSQLLVFNGKGLNNVAFSNVDDLRIGDEIVVYGGLTTFSNTKEVAANNYITSLKIKAPTFYPVAGAVASGTELAINSNHTTATVYYTTDNSDPTTGSSVYNENNKPTIASAITFKAMAVKSGYTTSEISSASYTILEPAEAPEFSPAAGTYNYVLSVTLSTETVDADIYYTTNGDNPTTSSTKYTEAIPVDKTTTIKAIAAKDGMANSAMSEATYTMNLPVITAENVNLTYSATSGSIAYTITNEVEGGVITSAVISDDTPSGWLTINGSNPYESPIGLTCTANETTSNRTATVTLTYTYNNDKTVTKAVTVTQSKPDYAPLPFTWDSTTTPTGITLSNVGTYNNTPCLKLNNNNGEGTVILKLNEAPGAIVFDIKANPSSGNYSTGTFKIMTSADGINYTTLDTYTSIGKTLEAKSFTNISSDTRYIKWSYTKDSNGNVALGNFIITKPSDVVAGSTTWNANSFTPDENTTYVIGDGATLTLEGDFSAIFDEPYKLIIEDGGQLITTSANVKATVKKNTSVSTPATRDEAVNNWYGITSPVSSMAITDFVKGDHNVYRYVEKSNYWNEYRNTTVDEELGLAPFATFENGRGYLYRSSVANVEFAGTVNIAAVDYTLSYANSNDNLKGINLIGNPFTHDIYKNDVAQDGENVAAINSNNLAVGYYRIQPDGSLPVQYGHDNPIKSGEAVFVKATEGFALTIANNNNNPAASYTPPTAKSGNNNIMFTVANNQYKDVAYAMFNEGIGLNKINHYNAEVQKLYINNNGTNYAIAMLGDDAQSFNLNFKAMTMGKYTLSTKANGNFSYLHLLDRLTGEDIDMLLDNEYSFIASPSDNDNRFIVKLSYAGNESSENEIFAYQSGNDIVVNGEGELQVFDVMGRMVMTQRINGVETINVPTNGMYIFRLNEKVQKIVVE